MFNFKQKTKDPPDYDSKLTSFLHIIKNYSVLAENFLDSLTYFTRVFDAAYASVYFYEKKTNTFLLRKWVGHEPSRFSISGDYEFMKLIKGRKGPVHRHEFFIKTSNEMRQPALFYFQQTLSNVVCPLFEDEDWLGLVNLQIDESHKENNAILFDSLIEIYADSLKRWLLCQRLLQEKKRLSELSHIKDQLLSNVTHELQTPLNGILGITDALLDSNEEPLPAQTKKHIDLIKKSGNELSQTVNNMLKLVQIEAKKDKVRKEKINILGLIKEVALLYSDACAGNKTKIVIPTSEEEIFVYVNADQIRTVLMNLVGNAVKFTTEGQISLHLKKSGEKLHISVLDTGIGIEDEKLNLIFEEFYQADGSHTRLYGGTGLGLAIAKKIVILHNGRIWAESQQGEGACFTFTLPMYPV
jgi:signal transduction histidine kinase